MKVYLQASEYIDSNHLAILTKAAELARGATEDQEIAVNCFEFVRDAIRHNWDWQQNPVTPVRPPTFCTMRQDTATQKAICSTRCFMPTLFRQA